MKLNLLCDLGSLAYATAQVVQLSTANLTAANNLELSNVRRMYREGLLYAYAVRNAANGYGLVYASVLLSNDDAFEYLNTLAVALLDLCVYNTWAHTYVLDAMSMRAARLDRNSPRYRELKSCAGSQVKKLNELASAMGGWGYLTYSGFSKRPAAQPTSFLTGTVLISAWMAGKSFGLSLDNKIFSRALKFLKSQRTPAGTYVYSLGHAFYPGRPINRHTGSLARTPACDYAIRLWEPEDISLRQLVDGLDRLWSRRGWLTMALHKPTPHESFAQNSGYFFYYGYYYSGMCLDMLAPNQVKRHASLLADDILTRQGTDGSWWDYPLYNYHKFYGTGYALYALSRAWDKLYGQPEPPSSLTSTPFRP